MFSGNDIYYSIHTFGSKNVTSINVSCRGWVGFDLAMGSENENKKYQLTMVMSITVLAYVHYSYFWCNYYF